MQLKLSLKRLQPHWPNDDRISASLSLVNRTASNQTYRNPTKTILKQVWLQGLPVRPSRIKVINTNDPNTALDDIKSINLLSYLQINNPDIALNPSNILTIIHIGFNIIGQYRKIWRNFGSIADFITSGPRNEFNLIGNNYRVLTLNESNINDLYDFLNHNEYESFWNTLCLIHYAFVSSIAYGAVNLTSETRPFPARRSGFCPRNGWNNTESFEQETRDADQDDILVINELEIRGWNRPIYDIHYDDQIPVIAQESIDPIIQQCVDILNQRTISNQTKQHVYDLILACISA
jgi:hypothetical protein